MKSTLSMLSSSNMHLYPATGLHKSVLYFLCLLWFSENECQKANLTLFWKWVLCDITKGTDSFSRYMTTVSASCSFCRVTSPHSCFFLKEKPSNMGANSVFLLRAVNRWLNSAFWNKTSKKGLECNQMHLRGSKMYRDLRERHECFHVTGATGRLLKRSSCDVWRHESA